MNTVYELGIGRWLWSFFRFGPLALGMWGGLGDAEVCARMAGNSEASDWVISYAEHEPIVSQRCLNMIARSFGTFSVTCQTILYFTCMIFALASFRQWIFMKCTMRALASEIAHFRNEIKSIDNRPHLDATA